MLRFSTGRELVEISSELLARHDVAAPRYTSYPTVPAWSAAFGATDFALALDRADIQRGVSLYVHIPFCKRRCWYCGCNVVTTQSTERANRYVDAVLAESAQVTRRWTTRPHVVQMQWGGGTPTFLTPAQIHRLAAGLFEGFHLADQAEAGVEIDPRVTTTEHLQVLREVGFNRVSLGVQDVNPVVQAAIGRVQPLEQTAYTVNEARRLGFKSVNLDLVYGLPHQTPLRWAETLRHVVDLRPDRVAAYSYAHLPSRFAHQRAIDESTLATGEDKLRLFTQAIEAFVANGYQYIGFDHFALPSDDLAHALAAGTLQRNFMGYSTHANTDLIGLGCSAISAVGGAFAQNEPTVEKYQHEIFTDRFTTVRGHWQSGDDRIRQAVIRALLCQNAVSRAAIEDEYAEVLAEQTFDEYFRDDLVRMAPLTNDGLVSDDGDTLRITPRGRLLARNVAVCFDAYLQQTQARTVGFSRSI